MCKCIILVIKYTSASLNGSHFIKLIYVTSFAPHSLWIHSVFVVPLIKIVLDINVGVQQVLSIRGQIHLVEDQVLKGLLQVGFADEHCSDHAPPAENHLEGGHRAFAPRVIRLQSDKTRTNWNDPPNLCSKSPAFSVGTSFTRHECVWRVDVKWIKSLHTQVEMSGFAS